MSKELLGALDLLEKEKGISKEYLIESLEIALATAYKRNYNQAQNVKVTFNQQKGNVDVFAIKTVVDDDDFQDGRLQIALKDALDINSVYEVGDEIQFEITPNDFGRIAVQTAKQIITQRVKEAERDVIVGQFSKYLDQMLMGEIERRDSKNIYVDIDGVEAVLPKVEQMANEEYEIHNKKKFYVSKVESDQKGAFILVSRTNPRLIERLFQNEVPEIYDGQVEIVAIAREAGDRTKIAVKSNSDNIDAVGTCVGQGGKRVQAVVDELNGENIDIIKYEDDPAEFIVNSLSPAEVIAVQFDQENEQNCTVIVPDDQLSLAIGKRGQNARLSAKLTNHKIDIKPVSEVEFVD